MSDSRKFQRRIESFRCEVCGRDVTGNGYTNHCPDCLWSKHVDLHPGDRAAGCGGLMEPHRLEWSASRRVLVHRCVTCGFERRNDVAQDDSFEALLAIARGERSRPLE